MVNIGKVAQENKWEVESAAQTLISVGPVKARMKKEPKFR
jgi:hypothetical protein